MKFKITDKEKELLLKFKNLSYPSIYKTDNTDNILFIEMVDFDVCVYLIKGEEINKQIIEEIMNSYNKFLLQINLDSFDDYTLSHYKMVLEIMKIFEKYYDVKDISH